METKLAKMKLLMAAKDYRAALQLAAGWPRLGTHRDAIQRGWAAYSNRDFYMQLGRDPASLGAAGGAPSRERYGLGEVCDGGEKDLTETKSSHAGGVGQTPGGRY